MRVGTTAQAAAVAAPPRAQATTDTRLRVAQLNAYNLFDTVDDKSISDIVKKPAQYRTHLQKLSLAIREKLGSPDVISLNEVENQKVLDDLLALPEMQQLGYRSVLGSRNDRRGISVAFLYRDSRLEVKKVEEFNPDVKLPDPASGQFDPAKLYARAPLAVDFQVRGAAQATEGALLTIIANHFKSKLGGDLPEKRREAQGQHLGGFVDARRAANPSTPVIVIGDLNATYEDGAFQKLAKRPDGSQRLHDLPLQLPEKDRYTYNYRGTNTLLDHLMVTDDLKQAVVGVSIPHFNTPKTARPKASDPKVPDGVSDHDPIIADFDLAKLLKARATK